MWGLVFVVEFGIATALTVAFSFLALVNCMFQTPSNARSCAVGHRRLPATFTGVMGARPSAAILRSVRE